MNNIELQKEIAVLQMTVQGLKQERNEFAAMFAVMRDALEDASDHLDYCGYGDAWERECANDAGLPEKIKKALSITGPAAVHEIRAQVLEEARDYFNGNLGYNFMYQEHALSGAYSDASGELDVMAAAERAKGEK